MNNLLNKDNKTLTICYFGIYEPNAPRDKVYLEGLRKLGFEFLSCVDNSAGISKFFRLAKKLHAFRNQYDIVWVGYLSTMVVPLVWLLSRKRIVFNALDSWYDRVVLDRGTYSRFSPVALVIWCVDFMAFHLSDIVLVESEQQKLFISKKFFVNQLKLQAVFTGVDERVFFPDVSVAKAKNFTVVFRGMFLPATGVEHVLEVAKILKDEDVYFRIIGWGEPLQSKLQKMIVDERLSKVNLTTVFLEPDELRKTMLSAHVMFGQFADHSRLERTIQNKNMEALALGLPLITRDSPSNRELLVDGANCLFVPPAFPSAIAEAILRLKADATLREKIALGARATYKEKINSSILAGQVVRIISGN